MSLRKMFLEANAQNIKYVVLNDNKSLPELLPEGEKEIRILVDAADKFKLIKVFDLVPCFPMLKERNEMFEPSQPVYDGLKFRVIPKGKGYFPEQFESKLLIGRHIVNNAVYNPPLSELAWVVLYEYVKHGYKLGTRQHKVIENRIESYIGITVYNDPHRPAKRDNTRDPKRIDQPEESEKNADDTTIVTATGPAEPATT